MKDRMKVLVVDDEQIIRDLLVEHLGSEGFNVLAVASGEEALEIFKKDPDHLVITDIRMGGMSGVQLLEEVKNVDENAVVIMITSHASMDTAVATLRAGAYDYIYKPFQDLNMITDVVNRAMDKIALVYQNRRLVGDLERKNQMIEQSNEALRELAVRDGLTGLFNHRHFKDMLESELVRCARFEHNLCLIMIDVDNFKDYNDNYGHPAGDEVLKILSDIMTTRLRAVDVGARYGGEEFAILLPETDWKGGKIVADDIRAQVENYPFKGNDENDIVKVTVSLGVADFPGDCSDTVSLLKKADEALYRAKSDGRNRVVCAVALG